MKIEYKTSAIEAINKLDKKLKKQLIDAINGLIQAPTLGPKIRRLEGAKGFYRLRVREHRIIYTVEESVLLITIVKVAPRGDAYKNLKGILS